jgi:hypothetical protein
MLNMGQELSHVITRADSCLYFACTWPVLLIKYTPSSEFHFCDLCFIIVWWIRTGKFFCAWLKKSPQFFCRKKCRQIFCRNNFHKTFLVKKMFSSKPQFFQNNFFTIFHIFCAWLKKCFSSKLQNFKGAVSFQFKVPICDLLSFNIGWHSYM